MTELVNALLAVLVVTLWVLHYWSREPKVYGWWVPIVGAGMCSLE
jgi:hypothetical protein